VEFTKHWLNYLRHKSSHSAGWKQQGLHKRNAEHRLGKFELEVTIEPRRCSAFQIMPPIGRIPNAWRGFPKPAVSPICNRRRAASRAASGLETRDTAD
jgi:hypothetical protein